MERFFGLLYLNLDDSKKDPNLLESIQQLRDSIQTELPDINFEIYRSLPTDKDKTQYIENLNGIKRRSQKAKLASDFKKYISYCEDIEKSLDLYQTIDAAANDPPPDKSDFSLFSFRKLLEMNIVTVNANKPLTDKFVKLECGHNFNYVPLFNDIKNHKSKFNSLEGNGTMLKENEINITYF